MEYVQVILNGLVALGTIAVAVVAAYAARSAERIAESDRSDAQKRDVANREHNELRYQLDHLVSIADALESRDQLVSAADRTEQNKVAGLLRARLLASPAQLPALEAVVFNRSVNAPVFNDIFQQYRDLLPLKLRDGTVEELSRVPEQAARAELYGKLRELRNNLARDRPD